MSNDSTPAPTQFYGFTGRKRHFDWHQPAEPQPVEDQPPAASNDSSRDVSDPDVVDSSAVGASDGSPARQGWELKREEAPSAVGATRGNPVDPPENAPPPTPPRRKTGSPRRRRTKAPAHTPESLLLSYHTRNCAICGSEYQDEIEDAFLSWESVDTIARRPRHRPLRPARPQHPPRPWPPHPPRRQSPRRLRGPHHPRRKNSRPPQRTRRMGRPRHAHRRLTRQ